MKKVAVVLVAFALTMGLAQAQDSKMKKKADVVEAKAEVAGDKAAIKANKMARETDKMTGDKAALKEHRKEHMKQEGELMKDRAKKDVKVVKEKL